MKTLLAACFAAIALMACPPLPVTPDAGGEGGVIADSAPPGPPDPPSCLFPGQRCCKICRVLAEHNCPEGKPTARGASCEEVCLNAEVGPQFLRTPDVSTCGSLDCIRVPTDSRHGIECKGGR